MGCVQHHKRNQSPSGTIVLLLVVLLIASFRSGRQSLNTLQSGAHASDSFPGDSSRLFNLGLSNRTKIILNIGSNLDPIVPRTETGVACAVTIAFEPIVHELIPSHPAVHVVPSAVADHDGLAVMHVYNTDGVSSSLSKPVMSAKWNRGKRAKGPKIVPLLSVKTIMQTLADRQIHFIKTDMQGFDFTAISSVPPELWKDKYQVPHFTTEVYLENVKTYFGANNDLCTEWLPFMKNAGYIFEGLLRKREGYESQKSLEETCRQQQIGGGDLVADKQDNAITLKEADALWRHHLQPSTPTNKISTVYNYPVLGHDKNDDFTAESRFSSCPS
ncbi:unnamed protein product [Cylindrotheca closterium]|uniref:Methyltransferase FkbM domain-containing protein n=1 Tax=Cylindrotheca closterium TaxID=2856 RepID=A0AAD2FYF6_9STRA|nr:unnamed protein product [Cylindrotheca closterium]